MPPRPLLIFDLEGTLADILLADEYMPRTLFSPRPRMVEGLKQLRADPAGYAIALATKAHPEQVRLFLSYVQQRGFEFDSVHEADAVIPKLPQGYEVWQMRFKDLSEAYAANGVSEDEISSRVLVVEDILLEPRDIFIGERTHTLGGGSYTKNPDDLFFTSSQCNAYGNPIPVNKKVPTVLLVPNQKTARFQTFSMDVVVDLVRKTHDVGEGDFERGYHCLDSEDIIKYESSLLRMQEHSVNSPLDYLNKTIRELRTQFAHRYLIVKGDSHPLETCERITL